MKQVIARAGKVLVAEVPAPSCSENGVLVRTESSVISTGTESWTIDSTGALSTTDIVKDTSLAKKAIRLSRDVMRKEGLRGLADYVEAVRNPEMPLGYSSSGVVVQVGSKVRDIVVGDRVACAGEGRATHSEVVFVPRNLIAKIPQGVSFQEAAFSTIGAIAIHAVRTAELAVGESVGVLGVGLVGNVVAQVASASGCRVVCIDLRKDRLDLIAEVKGAELTLSGDDPGLEKHLAHFTGGRGLDCVLLCAASTSSEPVRLAARICRDRGKVVVVGRVGMDLERKDFYQKELKLVMSRSLGPGRYDPDYEDLGVDYPFQYVRWTLNRNMEAFMELIRSRRIKVGPLVGREYPLEKADVAYAELGTVGGVASVLSYAEAAPVAAVEQPSRNAPVPVRTSQKIRVALVGPGGFAKETLIPTLRANPDYELRTVVSSNPLNASSVQRRYGFEKSTCNLDDVLSDPDVDLLVIASPNNLHAPTVEAAMKAGKRTVVEKPLCLTEGELRDIESLQRETGIPVVVGFNRRYAPLVLRVKKVMDDLDGPFVINYRVNAGFTQAAKWYNDPSVGGGRIIHECCHFFDLFNFLLGQADPEVAVAGSAGINGSSSVARDNISATLRYRDGSMANLLYVSLGDRKMERERLEVFGQGWSMVMSDFQNLTVYGREVEPYRLGSQDKGYASELAEVVKMLRGKQNAVISSRECFEAMSLTFKVDRAVRAASPS